MSRIYITLAVEDSLSEAVVRKMLAQSQKNYEVVNCLSKGGYGYLKKQINAFNQAAKTMPFFVLTDQDRGCPPEKIRNWLKHKLNPNLIFRIAVMEVESWVMAHRQSFAQFASVPIQRIPYNTDAIENPKEFLLAIVSKSRSKRLKDAIVPKRDSTAQTGPDYNAQLSNFIRNAWDVYEAQKNSESLDRAFNRIQIFEPISV
ncbi:hypothetical protein QUF75_06360 [Desulfococcaceae bacterium HSG7]|nr:hypothetical protein [Desulfococcaceae bacterium HSG7]